MPRLTHASPAALALALSREFPALPLGDAERLAVHPLGRRKARRAMRLARRAALASYYAAADAHADEVRS